MKTKFYFANVTHDAITIDCDEDHFHARCRNLEDLRIALMEVPCGITIWCSSSIDFPEGATSDPEVIDAVRAIREV